MNRLRKTQREAAQIDNGDALAVMLGAARQLQKDQRHPVRAKIKHALAPNFK